MAHIHNPLRTKRFQQTQKHNHFFCDGSILLWKKRLSSSDFKEQTYREATIANGDDIQKYWTGVLNGSEQGREVGLLKLMLIKAIFSAH